MPAKRKWWIYPNDEEAEQMDLLLAHYVALGTPGNPVKIARVLRELMREKVIQIRAGDNNRARIARVEKSVIAQATTLDQINARLAAIEASLIDVLRG